MKAMTPRQASNFYHSQARIQADNSDFLESYKLRQRAELVKELIDLDFFMHESSDGSRLIHSLKVDQEAIKIGLIYGHGDQVEELWTELMSILNQDYPAKKILYPFAISTWFPYRMLRSQEFPFFLDPPKMRELPLASDKGYEITNHDYYSLKQCSIKQTILHNQTAHKNVMEQGYSIRSLRKDDIANDLKILYELSCQSFDRNKFYEEISFEAFQNLYKSKIKLIPNAYVCFAVDPSGKECGFTFSLPDFTPILSQNNLYSLFGKLRAAFQIKFRPPAGIILKSTAVLKEHRRRGLESAMIYQLAEFAQQKGATYSIGAFVGLNQPSMRALGGGQNENHYRLIEATPLNP